MEAIKKIEVLFGISTKSVAMKILLLICLALAEMTYLLAQDSSLSNETLNFLPYHIGQYNANKPDSMPVPSDNKPGMALFIELAGKGFYSANIDFRIKGNHRLSVGLTSLDYDVVGERFNTWIWLSPGLMYYYLIGNRNSYFELSAGISIYPRWDKELYNDYWASIHGVIGYRYQKRDGFLFRAGFTPFYRPYYGLLPLIGLSFGYSW